MTFESQLIGSNQQMPDAACCYRPQGTAERRKVRIVLFHDSPLKKGEYIWAGIP